MEKKNHKFVIGLVLIGILALLFFMGPVQAFILGLTVDNPAPIIGEVITFTATLNIETMDKHLPVKNLTLKVNGPEDISCVFDVEGNNLTSCNGLDITRIHSLQIDDYGYGYGYGSEEGYGYDFGYGYGYGYNYGYGGKELEFKYNIEFDTTGHAIGEYDSWLEADIGEEVFDSAKKTIIIKNRVSGGSRRKNNPVGYTPIIHEEQESEVLDGEEIDFENSPEEKKGFFSLLTGAIIGALGTGTGIFAAAVFGILTLGLVGFAIRRKFF